MGEVHQFPSTTRRTGGAPDPEGDCEDCGSLHSPWSSHQRPSPEVLEELQGMFDTSWWVTRLELEFGDLETIGQMGPWCSPTDSELNDALLRVMAITRALVGPGRVRLRDGLEVIRDVADDLLRGVPQ